MPDSEDKRRPLPIVEERRRVRVETQGERMGRMEQQNDDLSIDFGELKSEIKEIKDKVDKVSVSLIHSDHVRDTLEIKIDHVIDRVDNFHINGHGPAIVELAQSMPEIKEALRVSKQLTTVLPEVVKIATKKKEMDGGIQWVSDLTLIKFFKLGFMVCIGPAAGAAITLLLTHVWHIHP